MTFKLLVISEGRCVMLHLLSTPAALELVVLGLSMGAKYMITEYVIKHFALGPTAFGKGWQYYLAATLVINVIVIGMVIYPHMDWRMTILVCVFDAALITTAFISLYVQWQHSQPLSYECNGCFYSRMFTTLLYLSVVAVVGAMVINHGKVQTKPTIESTPVFIEPLEEIQNEQKESES